MVHKNYGTGGHKLGDECTKLWNALHRKCQYTWVLSCKFTDNYDKEVKSRVGEKSRHVNHRPKRPDAVKYIPPYRHEQTHEQTQGTQEEEEEDDMPKRLFTFEFEDKDGQIYKQYVNEGVTAAVLAMRMGHDRKLPATMVNVLEQWLQEEIDKRTHGKSS